MRLSPLAAPRLIGNMNHYFFLFCCWCLQCICNILQVISELSVYLSKKIHKNFLKSELFATMLTDPRMNADDVTPSCGLFLTCRGKKYLQYYIRRSIKQYLCVGSLNAKSPLVLWPSMQGANLTPLWSHAENQPPGFLQTTGLTPSKARPFFNPICPYMQRNFILGEDDISTSEALSVGHMYFLWIRYIIAKTNESKNDMSKNLFWKFRIKEFKL
jgi:hypothetical protein